MTGTQTCGAADGRIRLDHARHFLDVAEIVHDNDLDASLSVAASLCVLSGIAAADAASCIALGERARGQGHHEAEQVVGRVPGVGDEMARRCGNCSISRTRRTTACSTSAGRKTTTTLRSARRLVELAERVALR